MTPALAAALAAMALLMLPGRAASAHRLRLLRSPAPDMSAPQPYSRSASDPLGVVTALDLLAACLRSGLPAAIAAAAVAAESPEPLATVLRRAADLLALGADPAAAWAQAAAGFTDDAVTALARMARRSARSGTGLATAVAELAQRRRGELEDAAAARAERAGVLIGGPLGLCFLPAFLCLGIVPVVIGLAGRVLEGGLL
ncbi:type II secretion system F family protein [Nocardia yunnanensis]|uniref:Type II secretion system F family protein n=1 Tax=Nocardia yunnanensis TaxID=2382165 RepID=A0A386Z7B7_9NOCA|nr:type II secretion system F family protein [Nocardia yunnanensis]AYF73153.1 type II secretion system F family protein [Nocardia yunnanensis]